MRIQPSTSRLSVTGRARGCIVRSEFGRSLRRTLLKISDQIGRKLRRSTEPASVSRPMRRSGLASCRRRVQPTRIPRSAPCVRSPRPTRQKPIPRPIYTTRTNRILALPGTGQIFASMFRCHRSPLLTPGFFATPFRFRAHWQKRLQAFRLPSQLTGILPCQHCHTFIGPSWIDAALVAIQKTKWLGT